MEGSNTLDSTAGKIHHPVGGVNSERPLNKKKTKKKRPSVSERVVFYGCLMFNKLLLIRSLLLCSQGQMLSTLFKKKKLDIYIDNNLWL